MRKISLIAIGVFVALTVVVFATREKKVSVGVRKLDIPQVDKAQVTAITLSGPVNVQLTKTAEGWRVADKAKPEVRFLADTAQVEAALGAYNDTRNVEFVSDRKEKVDSLWIADGKGLTVRIERSGGEPVERVFGNPGAGNGFFVRKPNSNEVFAYTGRVDGLMRKDVKQWRKKALFSFKAEDITGMELKSKDGELVKLSVSGEGGDWKLEAPPPPVGFRFDPGAARQLAMQLSTASAQDFLDGDSAADEKTGLGAPHDILTATLKDGKSVVMHLAAPSDANAPVPTKIEGDAQVYALSSWTANALRKRLSDLRDMSLLDFNPAEVKALEISTGGKKTLVAKVAGAWKLMEPKVPPAGVDFEPSQVDAQLSALRNARATQVAEKVSEAAAGLAAGSTVVGITLESGKQQVLKFGKATASPNEVYVKGARDSLVYVAPDWLKSRMSQGVAFFKKPPPMPNQGIQGLEQLPPEIRKQLEAQLRQQGH